MSKIVLGLKADENPPLFDTDSDGNFFSSDEDTGGQLLISNVVPLMPKPPGLSISLPKAENKVVQFTDASSRITPLISQFSEITKIQKNFSNVYLVPETPSTDELTPTLNEFISGEKTTLDVDYDTFDMNICCQFDIIKYSKDHTISLKSYEKAKLDSRISSLLYFILANTEDKGVSAHYYISCLEEIAKFPSYAPVSILFEDFSLKTVVEKLTTALCNLFPKHPILESVVNSLSKIDPVANKVLENKKKEEEEANKSKALGAFEDDSDDDWSDSFFASLKQVADSRSNQAILTMTIDDTPKNPLEIVSTAPKVEEVKLNPPPTTVTYLLKDGTEQLGMQHFVDWLNSFAPPISMTQAVIQNHLQQQKIQIQQNTMTVRPAKKSPAPQINPNKLSQIHPSMSSVQKQMQSQSYQSQPLFGNCDSNSYQESPKPKEYDEEYFENLFDMFSEPMELLQNLPNQEVTAYFPIYYPTLEYLNSTRVSAAVKKGCAYPTLIECEYEAHLSLKEHDSKKTIKIIDSLTELIHTNHWSAENIEPLKQKRFMPSDNTLNDGTDVISVLALADIQFILDGRSPLTGERLTDPIIATGNFHPAFEKSMRVRSLYDLYKSNEYPPYIAFKVGFALSFGVLDYKPKIACDLIFEALYILSESFPKLKYTSLARHAILFLGESLEKTDRYYNAVMAFDAYFRIDILDLSASPTIAQLAYKNKDMLRAVFYYTESIKRLIRDNRNADKALYICKTCAGIYAGNGLNSSAMSLYIYLLKNTYNITVSQVLPLQMRQINDIPRSGSVKAARISLSMMTNDQFTATPDINTALCGLQCVQLLIKSRRFKQARELLDAVTKTSSGMLSKMVSYLNTYLLLKENQFKDVIQTFPKFEIMKDRKKVTSSSRLTIESGAAFDFNGALVNLLAKLYLERNMYILSLYWSEVIIQITNKNMFRDLGYGYYFRGLSFMSALGNAIGHTQPIELVCPFPDDNQHPTQYVDPSIKLDVKELASETLASLFTARFYFDKCGAIKKSAEAGLAYLDVAISLFFGNENSELTVTFGAPNLITKLKEPTDLTELPKSVPLTTTTTLTSENISNEIAIQLNLASKNAARIMHPYYIIYSQILQARLSMLNNDLKNAKIYFDFAFQNLKKHFTSGPIFLPKLVSLTFLNKFKRVLALMVETLLQFPKEDKEFINERLVIFDIYNDICQTLHSKLSNLIPDNTQRLTPSIDLDSSVVTMHNPKLPNFGDVLEEVGILGPMENDTILNKKGYTTFLRILNANIHLFESQKLTESEMHERNRMVCKRMEQIAESQRRQMPQLNPVDSSFNVALKINMSLFRTIIIFKINGFMITYIPSLGETYKVRVTGVDKDSIFQIRAFDRPQTFKISSNLFPPEFIEQTSTFIFVDKKNHELINKAKTMAGMKKAREHLFGPLLKMEDIFGVKSPSIPDDNTFGESSFFFSSSALKGALKTLAVGAPLIFYLGFEISQLPVELMFHDTFVLRAQSYMKLLLHMSNTSVPPPRMVCARYLMEPVDLLLNGVVRSIDLVKETCSNLGNNDVTVLNVVKTGRNLPFPFSLYSSNKTIEEYQAKYDFCDFLEIKDGGFPNGVNNISLFVFQYADMVEMPLFVSKLMSDYPFSFFMFIPSGAVREAFNEMALIFARQKKRVEWLKANQGKQRCANDTYICKSGILFVGALQRTLIDKLKVPIPLFSPLGLE